MAYVYRKRFFPYDDMAKNEEKVVILGVNLLK